MAPHSSTLAWKIPWTEEAGRLQSMGSLKVGHDWATLLSFFTSCIGEGNGNPLQCSCLENPRDKGAWWAAVYGVTQSWTWLKRLSKTAQQVKNQETQETQFQSLVQEDSPGGGNGNPLQYSCLENSMDREASRATVHGVTKSQTRLSN